MLGVIFGTACLAGSFFVLRRARRYAWRAAAGGRGRWSWRGPMRWVFERLDTSPGQEKVLVQAAEDVSEAASKLRDLWGDTRAGWAKSLRGEAFDAAALRELDAQQDARIEELRKTIHASLGRIHEALDPKQRQELADLIERGGRPHSGRHRDYGGCHRGWRGASAY